jgi:uncharacterized protein YkwD
VAAFFAMRFVCRFGFIVLAAVGWLGLAPIPAAADDEDNGGTKELSRSLEHETFDLINDYREREGFPRFVWSSGVANIARLHSRDMATGAVDFGHEGFRDRMDELHGMFSGMRGGGENVFYTDAVPGVARLAVQSWLHSAPHLHNIRGDYQYSGLGLWRRADGSYFFTQIFVQTAGQPADVP